MVTLSQWATQLVQLLGGNPSVVPGIVAQCLGEYGPSVYESNGMRANGNPLDTTMAWQNATDFNNVGVKNYATIQDGLLATAATLRLSYYAAAMQAIMSGDPQAYVVAIANSPWGTFHNDPAAATAMLQQVNANPQYSNFVVAGVNAATASETSTTSTEDITVNGGVAYDHVSGGFWVVDELGEVYAFDGAPYAGGLNTHPEWQAGGGAANGPAIGIGFCGATNGYVIVTRDNNGGIHPYRFGRTP